ncbi:type IIS restriction enzyme Eco57I [Ruminiclostridium hungatei]|uniref:site-specific DNA-methyltransferase (adenine-specific) n=1 Tax=Ruminiclostridium hungatei TaxID=48256 RepID=A0A1V4SDA1_RUMHU|nr:N-6 DNA methylase [Ruminiclostridium hungatei]OPX41892.1 type IIS restriction enzyme Eco57I [Ruminiclostridium hungatei]
MINKSDSFNLIKELVRKYEKDYEEYKKSTYNETHLRNDFINPLLTALGWDVDNSKKVPQHLREVIHEDSINVEEENMFTRKKPDYAIRVGTERKLFIEVKKPSVDIENSDKSAFQLRRYGWSANLLVSVLTNFEKLIIYDCKVRPGLDDNAKVARIKVYDFKDFISDFDKIYEILSYDSLYSGSFDKIFDDVGKTQKKEPFDNYFLNQIEKWREWLAVNIFKNNINISQRQLNLWVQTLINRIIFLRICEDRNLERYESLKTIKNYSELKIIFTKADEKYNSGLFSMVSNSQLNNVNIDGNVLLSIFQELYYPLSPYDFSVVEASLLGEIYELFLAKEITIVDSKVIVTNKPEIIESSAVVSTPKFIADYIVKQTLDPICIGKNPDELEKIKICDIACGSGVFLISVYDYLYSCYLEWYQNDEPQNHSDKIYLGKNSQYYLTLFQKQQILTNNIYGVDIDTQAVEVAKFSLLVKIIENESEEEIDAYLINKNIRALPHLDQNIRCGNSLVDSTYFEYNEDAILSHKQVVEINPFDWKSEFMEIYENGGFDAIVTNPPYIRIQNMVKYSPLEVGFYKSKLSHYQSAKKDNFDKYYLFIERTFELLQTNGKAGFIVPHKFFTLKFGETLRKLISDGKHLTQVVSFGTQQIFNKTQTYTCILILSNSKSDTFSVEHVNDIDYWKYVKGSMIDYYESNYVCNEPWIFVNPKIRKFFERLTAENILTLEEITDIFVGVQTSSDDIYIVIPKTETENTVTFEDINKKSWTIEKGILRPCLLDVSLYAFGKANTNAYMIFPYDQNRINGRRATLYSEEEMNLLFPKCWEYLNWHKPKLLKRSIQNSTQDTWYRFGRSQSLTKFDGKEKLIWPVLSLVPEYVYDDENIVVTGGGNGPYYLLRMKENSTLSIFYIQAILSHPVFEAFIRARASMFRGDYGSHGKQFLINLPIHNVNLSNRDEVHIYNRIIEYAKALNDIGRKKVYSDPCEDEAYNKQRSKILWNLHKLIEKIYGIEYNELELIQELL